MVGWIHMICNYCSNLMHLTSLYCKNGFSIQLLIGVFDLLNGVVDISKIAIATGLSHAPLIASDGPSPYSLAWCVVLLLLL